MHLGKEKLSCYAIRCSNEAEGAACSGVCRARDGTEKTAGWFKGTCDME